MNEAVDTEFLQKDPSLVEIVRRLADAYQPERIYLFGSKARGDAGPDSDYDLLLVVPDGVSAKQRDGGLAYRVLWGLWTPWCAAAAGSTRGRI